VGLQREVACPDRCIQLFESVMRGAVVADKSMPRRLPKLMLDGASTYRLFALDNLNGAGD
jgi:hypothetical protein